MLELIFVICAVFGACFIVLGIAGVIVEAFNHHRLIRNNKKMMAEYIEASRRG